MTPIRRPSGTRDQVRFETATSRTRKTKRPLGSASQLSQNASCCAHSHAKRAEFPFSRAALLGGGDHCGYVEHREIARELRRTNALSKKYGWHCIDVSYKSVEEFAYQIIQLLGLK